MELLDRLIYVLLLLIVLVVVIAAAFQAPPQQTIKAGYADSSAFATQDPLAHEQAHARYTAPAIVKERRMNS